MYSPSSNAKLACWGILAASRARLIPTIFNFKFLKDLKVLGLYQYETLYLYKAELHCNEFLIGFSEHTNIHEPRGQRNYLTW